MKAVFGLLLIGIGGVLLFVAFKDIGSMNLVNPGGPTTGGTYTLPGGGTVTGVPGLPGVNFPWATGGIGTRG